MIKEAVMAWDTSGEYRPLGLLAQSAKEEGFALVEGGGVTSAAGFSASGIHAGFRDDPDRLDLALVVSDEPAACAATFTQNVFRAAPVSVSRDHFEGLSYGTARALVVNSGVANAATGDQGIEDARRTAEIVAGSVGCPPSEVMVASTGVIGVRLQMDVFESGVPRAYGALSDSGGAAAAKAIMTTDTHSKEAAVTFLGDDIGYPGCVFTVGGMAKGSGMIMPNMATMISCITTDAPLLPDVLHEALVDVVAQTFNKVTVDSDTSTNDSCFLFANGAAAAHDAPFERGSNALALFKQALMAVCMTLAREMARDGEGATRLVTVHVGGARTQRDADLAARAVANSPLVKTAIYGHDANWGRIAMALGRSGACFDQSDVDIDIMGIPVCRKGLAVAFDEDEALRRFESPEVEIEAWLGAGAESTTLFTCDFSHEYVTINGEYRT